MRGAAQGTTRVESRYTIQTCDPSVSRTAVRWGPQFFFERPAKIPRSSLRSFSLWARHSVGTGAEPTCDGCGRNFSIVAPDAGADDD